MYKDPSRARFPKKEQPYTDVCKFSKRGMKQIWLGHGKRQIRKNITWKSRNMKVIIEICFSSDVDC